MASTRFIVNFATAYGHNILQRDGQSPIVALPPGMAEQFVSTLKYIQYKGK